MLHIIFLVMTTASSSTKLGNENIEIKTQKRNYVSNATAWSVTGVAFVGFCVTIAVVYVRSRPNSSNIPENSLTREYIVPANPFSKPTSPPPQKK